MAETDKSDLRIFCICGQKMKVSSDVFGHPAKCVACRQKIRIPRADEIPPDTREIHLSAHPEFLRRVKRHITAADIEPDVVSLGNMQTASEVALEILEPLRLLCSLEYSLSRSNGHSKDGADLASPSDTAALTRVRQARADLDQELRKQLQQVSENAHTAAEELALLSVAVRTGERDFLAARERLGELRSRRDHLERHRQNLKGWLTCDDVFAAGGHDRQATLNHIPSDGFNITFLAEPESFRPLVESQVEALRDVLLMQERAQRTLHETERVITEGRTGCELLEPNVVSAKSEIGRAKAGVAFVRGRLERLGRDSVSDAQAVESQLQRARNNLTDGTLDQARYHALRHDLRGVAGEIELTKRLIARALRATSAKDVPEGVLSMGGVSGWDGGMVTHADTWLSWSAAALFLICLFIPMFEGTSCLAVLGSDSATPLLRTLALGFVVFSLSCACMGFVARRSVRGWGFCLVGLGSCLAGTYWLHEAKYAAGPLGYAIREEGALMWLMRPGMLLAASSAGLVLLAGWIALGPSKASRRISFSVIALTLGILAVAIMTNFGGYSRPHPQVSQTSHVLSAQGDARFETIITLGNSGSRPYGLLDGTSSPAHICHFSLERQQGTGVWMDAGAPRTVRIGGVERDAPWAHVSVGPEEEADLVYELTSGHYRMRLTPAWPHSDPIVVGFTLAVDSNVSAETVLDSKVVAPSESHSVEMSHQPQDASQAKKGGGGIIVELCGIASAEGLEPHFAVTLTMPDGTIVKRDLRLRGELHAPWQLVEYNPQQQTVTLSGDGQLVILRRGEPALLPHPQTQQP